MKQAIISNCFDKMKRVVLTLFAALCVGSVWGASRGVFWSAPPTVSLSPTGLITITDANNYTWDKDNSGLTQNNYNTAVNNLKCTDTMDYTLHTVDGQEITKTVTVKAEYAVNSVGWHGINIDLGGPYTYQIEDWAAYQISSVDIRFTAALNKTVASTIDYKDLADRQTFAYDYTFEMKGVLSTSSIWDADSSKFVITGDALDSRVRVKYAIGGDELAASSELATVVDVEVSGTAYSLEIPYTDETKLVYSVYAIDGDTESIFVNAEGKSVFVLKKWDNARVTYTWASESAGNWTDPKNWTPNITPAYGYPGTKGEQYFFTSVCFESDAEVDLENGTYTLKDGGASLYFASGANVLLKNGNLGLMPEGAEGDREYALGGTGATVEYRDVKLIYSAENSGLFNLAFAAGSTNIFAGSISHPWNYLPLYANTKLVFKDGEISTEYSKSTFSNLSSQEVEINNAKWTIKVTNSPDGAKSGIAGLVKFRDGADRQARLVVNSKKALKLLGTYDFVLPATPYATAYVEAGAANAVESSFNVRVDASNISDECKVPLIEFSATDDATKTAMQAVADNAAKLQVVVDGEVVDNASRSAMLVWDETATTLYYQQGVAASIGDTKYSTLEAAIEAVGVGDTVKLVADIELTSYLPITKSLTLDLNKKSIRRADGTGIYVNGADAQVVLTNGTIEASNIPVYVNLATTVDIYDCVVRNTDSNETVYVQTSGTVRIYSGTFSTDNQYDGKYWVLNVNDSNRENAKIQVYGGKFVNFNPQDCDIEGEGTNFCAKGYVATLDNEGYYVVAEKTAETVVPGAEGSVTVSASTEDEALDKVKLDVTVPDVEGLDANTYKGYFALKATETVTGSGIWAVEAVLNDEVKPVIAETTADDTTKEAFVIDANGNVTLNINNKKPGLYYGVQVLAELGADPEVTVSGLVVPAKDLPEGNAAFFRVVVDFKPFVVPEAE